jgi:hypothetical protein
VAGYLLEEQTALNIPINHAILNLSNHRILANIHRLHQFNQREQDLHKWNWHLEKTKEFILVERYEYFTKKRKITQGRLNVEKRLKKAKLATHLNEIIKQVELERKPIKWPQPQNIVLPIVIGAGPSDSI